MPHEVREVLTMARARIPDTWASGSPYERFIGRWSRRVAPPFLAWLGVPAGRRWLDVGCGTGALCAAILDHCAPASVAGVEPSPGFLEAARENLAGRASLHEGSATAIPLRAGSVHAAVSGLVLNFVPDQTAALAEMARVTARGGTVAAYVWDYAGRMEILRRFWDAAVELDPAAAELDEGARFPLCRPDVLERRFADAGLGDVEVKPIEITAGFESFDDYWQPFLGGQGPAPAYTLSLEESARTRLRERIRRRMPVARDGSFSLVARAWAARATAGA